MAIVNANGDIVENDKVIVYVCKLDLNLYKPRFVDGIEHQVPKGQEETLGAQTFVNLDSDDNDDKFDNIDDKIKGGDDEFIRVEFIFDLIGLGTLTPPSKPINIRIENVPGKSAEAIKLWKSDDKDAGSLDFGESLTLQKVTSTSYKKSIWVEGVIGHTSQRQSQIVAKFNDDSGSNSECESVKASFTIIGIKSISWSAQTLSGQSFYNGYTGDGRNNSSVLDNFASENDYPDHIRIFPEQKFGPSGVTSEFFNKASLQVCLTVTPIEIVALYLKPFDADDPSDDVDIDPNDEDIFTHGEYQGKGLATSWSTWTTDNDNRARGVDSQLGQYSKSLNVIDFEIDASTSDINYKITTVYNVFELIIKTSSFPGDNYQVAIYCDKDFIIKTRNRDRYDHGKIVFDSPGCGYDCKAINNSLLSKVLTVWRTLHVEYDKMENPFWAQNVISGYFSDFGGPQGKFSKARFVSNIKGNQYFDPPAYTLGPPAVPFNSNEPLNDNSILPRRFEWGKIRIGDPPSEVCSPKPTVKCLVGNSENKVVFNNETDLTFGGTLNCVLRNSSPSGLISNSFQIQDMIRLSTGIINVKVSNPSGINFSLFNGGDLSIAGGPYCTGCVQNIVNDNLQFNILDGVNNLKIPIEVSDDDSIPVEGISSVISKLTFNIAKLRFNKAYIDVNNDGGGVSSNNQSSISFVRGVIQNVAFEAGFVPFGLDKTNDKYDDDQRRIPSLSGQPLAGVGSLRQGEGFLRI